MLNKYAITIGSSQSYAMGLNATLNALDYYGVKDIDVYVFSNKHMKEYFEFAEGKFSFPLYYVEVDELCAPYQTHFADDGGVAWNDVVFFWAKYPLFYKIKDQYDAILHLDGDCMVVDDISAQFKVAAETGKIVIAENGRSSLPLSDITLPHWNTSEDRLLEFCMGFPVLNYVFFFDAKKYVELIDYVWEFRNNSVRNTKHFGLETAYFVQGLYKLNLLDKIIQLPYSHWMSDSYLNHTKIPLQIDSNGKYHLIAPDGNSLKVVHSRFWHPHGINHTAKLTNKDTHPLQYECLMFNAESHTKMTDFLNYDWKVKLNEVVEKHRHYSGFLTQERAWTILTRLLDTP